MKFYRYLMGHYGSCLEEVLMLVRLTAYRGIVVLLGGIFGGIFVSVNSMGAIAAPLPLGETSPKSADTTSKIAPETAPEPFAEEPFTEAPEEIPEEILRTEIITAARSPLTGEPLSAAEYAQLQTELATPALTPTLSNDIRYLIFLLQIRRAVTPILPFVR
ncbi:MAG: hypothetical protein HLUCCA11_15785 [Phormidesmis priestleyi Ana]|uniref:Uncharacterized protein n=1 Tax=Phormidesmis priestleyi Ana TaxID=1666911 RepID=A0A0P7YUF6_9CYAN|nr:MAG: hypothetical protein HLUCCA11_15785 [Phormidesmis priestleyi Ana]